ncbi:similar to Saccharomyces cerevisiae YDL101C DUN1 Cell-cycle checkpoint serine- threonine kinase required for DNA damage-induced transcription of certain target genes [Maudiozyma barnettii]|uniref:Similar to Saccharomyces cerevisiae YDL101C DUN1 Cell-cycle checkpoint serine- threonine kinase required for DNA damage-induced transcription of certain target genes n=1 Tax=Maudiozyma barnettii TaxID=61262 RepID=A0A8H2ZMG7_9SACH|nr:serine/threonine protein kinase DUN1 [Kazachstania barnettii]CAB4257077.1 similar to Saccharomyces cerevisiae YDL101C DUN1 Cell-cycle checkpoint serine- threonine kinase required for DNA damage-induced transcription of certain target genes [Kazachstania barnettii]CAD1779448.1 similar to Saccharomyces cerevisiae YDL101C DUN1 Cell-cycle checkpoint serine- threonine kinase required for DNA damage-induced transcription of certain target genes [Kazachstania barnettii]
MSVAQSISKREHSDDILQSNKRQQTGLTNLQEKEILPVVAQLFNLIPGKECTYDITEKSVTTIGRSRSCNITLNEPDISTVHCELHLIDMEVDGVHRKLINIIDKSRNGTFINGSRLVKKDCILKNGDRIVFGKTFSFLFKYSSISDLDNTGSNFITAVPDLDSTVATGESKDENNVFKKPQFSFTSSQNALKRQARPKPSSVFDKYLIGKELGSGHYAIVKDGTNKQTGQTVAIKIFHPQQNDDQKKSKQFREETNILMRIHHPNIVNLLDSYVEPISKSQIQKYLVLEKIVDGELFERIVKKTSLRQDETKAIFKQILVGLKYLHNQNIIHRDIKPENILLNITRRTSSEQLQLGPWDEGEIDIQVKIADFGLAKFTGEMQFTNTLCGTPSYVAPEVLTKTGYTSKVDMWSAGVILYVCLCGFPPFSEQLGPPSLKEQILQAKYAFYTPYWDNIDDSILHLISHLLVLDASQRYSVDDVFEHEWLKDSTPQTNVIKDMKRLQLGDGQLPKTYSEMSCL